MIYAASSHSSAVLRKQASSRQSLNDKPNTSRSSSSASSSKRLVISAPRPGTANGFKARRPTTPEKSNTRLKELKEIFHLTEKDLHDFYRVFCFFLANKQSSSGEVSPRRPWEEKEVLPMKRSNNALTDFFAAFSVPTN
eukprot:scaffold2392_cov198-Alexandrium_tamarense.AAC.1